MNKKNVAITLTLLFVAGIAGYFTLTKNQSSAPQPQPIVFSTQEECEQTTGKPCSFQMCDYVPQGKILADVCGKDFKKGWKVDPTSGGLD
ncbi:MAG: hypothetical protein AAB408_05165 [Patescibacteria group bacterium]